MLTFTDYLLCAKHHAKHFTYIASFNSELSYYPYFISEETGPETSKLPRLLNFSVVDLGLTVGILTPESTCSLSLPPHNWNRVLN